MRRFACGVCAAEVAFTDAVCGACGGDLGYVPELGDIVPLRPAGGPDYLIDGPGGATGVWRCLNFAWGCNWVLAADSGAVWCASCRLTRGRPDGSSPDAVAAWSVAEAAKRRLVHQLRSLGLPIGDEVKFDLVFLPESRGVTGHLPGVVTLDLREADDAYREAARLHFGERDRTVLGHLRHEIGHHYWALLVERAGQVDAFRSVFGDERADYATALAEHYDWLDRTVPDTHISGYAAAHPSEDWAETFAHDLHLRDGLETAAAFGLVPAGLPGEAFADVLARWRTVARAVGELSLGLGHVAPYPFVITAPVAAKLALVHALVAAAASAG